MRSTGTATAWIFTACTLVGSSLAAGEEPPPGDRLAVIAPMKEGLNITGINGRGDVVGFHWEPENGNPDILYEAPFLARGGEIVRLPLLPGYTSTFPAGVSDDGMVVGRVSKPSPPNARVYLRNQAFYWTAEKGIVGLGASEPDSASFATGVSRDGRRIAGIGVGDYRLRGLLWERNGDGWKALLLPDADQLGSNVLTISPDGKRLAAVQKGETSLWTETAPGEWNRESLPATASPLLPRAVNDSGVVVGHCNAPDGEVRAVVWSRERGTETIALPAGFQHSQATAVNNAGLVVGQVDGPHGRLPGPRAFAYRDGKLRLIDEGGPDFIWATAVNDQGQVAGVLEEAEEIHEDEAPAEEPVKNP